MKNIMNHLTFKQKFRLCIWGPDRRYKYFDYIADGMNQRAAWKRAKDWKK